MPIGAFLLAVNGPYLRGPLDSNKLQYLVGKSKAEALQAIGGRIPITSGMMEDEDGERQFESYYGATVYYSMEGQVLSVEPTAVPGAER
jgi:hypothetical protein